MSHLSDLSELFIVKNPDGVEKVVNSWSVFEFSKTIITILTINTFRSDSNRPYIFWNQELPLVEYELAFDIVLSLRW